MTAETENFAIKGYLVPCYETKVDCEARIAELDEADKCLKHGESARPTLSPRYVVRYGKRRWYIYAEYRYYEGTYTIKIGPLERVE